MRHEISWKMVHDEKNDKYYLSGFVESSNNFVMLFDLNEVNSNDQIFGIVRLGNDAGVYPIRVYVDERCVKMITTDEESDISDFEYLVNFIYNGFRDRFSSLYYSLSDIMTSLGSMKNDEHPVVYRTEFPQENEHGLIAWGLQDLKRYKNSNSLI